MPIDPKEEATKQRDLAAQASAAVQSVREETLGAERNRLSQSGLLRPEPKKKKKMGYQEQSFREKAGIAEEQYRAGVAEQALMSRRMKQLGRGDFKQQRQKQLTKVFHVARVQQRGGARGLTGAAGRGVTGRPTPRGGMKQTGMGLASLKAEQKRTTLTAGGMAQVDTSKQWTTSGWQPKEPPHAKAYFVSRSVVEGNRRNEWAAKHLGGIKPSPPKGVDAYERKRERLRDLYRRKSRLGPEATRKVMAEWEQRQIGLFGNIASGLAKLTGGAEE